MEEVSLTPVCMNCGSNIELDWHHGVMKRIRCPQCHIEPVVLQREIATNCKCCCQPLAIDLDRGYIFCSNSACISWKIEKEEDIDSDVYILFYKDSGVLSYYADTKTVMIPTTNGFYVVSDPNSFLVKLFNSVFKRLFGIIPGKKLEELPENPTIKDIEINLKKKVSKKSEKQQDKIKKPVFKKK